MQGRIFLIYLYIFFQTTVAYELDEYYCKYEQGNYLVCRHCADLNDENCEKSIVFSKKSRIWYICDIVLFVWFLFPLTDGLNQLMSSSHFQACSLFMSQCSLVWGNVLLP